MRKTHDHYKVNEWMNNKLNKQVKFSRINRKKLFNK